MGHSWQGPGSGEIAGKMYCDCFLFSPQHTGHREAQGFQQQLKVAEHKLIQSVATRWNSVFYMLQRLFEQKNTVSTALCLWGKNTLCLDEGEFSLIKQTVDSLQPFEEVTCKISAEKYVSVSKVIPLVSLIHRAVAECECQGSSLASQLAQQCQRRFRGIETIDCLAASTCLDVRFKHLGFRDKGNVEIVEKTSSLWIAGRLSDRTRSSQFSSKLNSYC